MEEPAMPDVYCEVCEQRLPIEVTYRAGDFMGHSYFFCSIEDEEKFLKDPETYIKRDKEKFQISQKDLSERK
jgi:YHS domain-containing protein